MSPRKLTEDDKQEIIQLYRNSEATTSTLAIQYGVSSSTISRFLKNKFTKAEYEDLIQQKRLARTPRGEKSATDNQTQAAAKKSKPKAKAKAKVEQLAFAVESDRAATKESKRSPRRRRRTSAATDPDAIAVAESATTSQVEGKDIVSQETTKDSIITTSNKPKTTSSLRPLLKKDQILDKIDDFDEDNEIDEVDVVALGEMLGEDLIDIDDDEDDEDDDWEADYDDNITYPHADSRDFDVQILPLSAASFPRTCYLVIDRSAELIVKPLKDFADLGSIPDEEIKQKTLPVFDNHRIAKRFSHRRERVIKVPDGKMLAKTSRHLNAKGITRMLIDGKIYSL